MGAHLLAFSLALDCRAGRVRYSTASRGHGLSWAVGAGLGTPTDPDGSARQQVTDLNRQFYYVSRRLLMTNHISFDEIPSGDYQVALTVVDGVGNQRYEHALGFTIHP